MQILLRDLPRDGWRGHPGFARSIDNWMGAHQGFRRLGAILQSDSESFLDKGLEAERYAGRLAHFGNLLVRNLHGHHTWEDRQYFPELQAADPRFADGLEMLEGDHEELDGLIEQFTRCQPGSAACRARPGRDAGRGWPRARPCRADERFSRPPPDGRGGSDRANPAASQVACLTIGKAPEGAFPSDRFQRIDSSAGDWCGHRGEIFMARTTKHSTDTSPEITLASWLMILTLGLVWGGTFLFQNLALRSTDPFWVATARIGFAGALSGLVWQVRGAHMFTTAARDWPRLILVSLLSSAVPFLFLSWGQLHVTSAFTGVSMATVALFVLPLAHVLVPGERMTRRRTLGFLLGFGGVALLVGPDAFRSSGQDLEKWGQLACLAAAACYAISSIMIRRLPPIDPFGLTFATLAFGLCLVLPLALVVHGPPAYPGHQGMAILALLGLVPTAGANLLRILTIRSAGPVFMSLTNYLVPVFAVIFGAAFLSEPLPGSLLSALALILAGVGLSQYGALKRLFFKGS